MTFDESWVKNENVKALINFQTLNNKRHKILSIILLETKKFYYGNTDLHSWNISSAKGYKLRMVNFSLRI